MAVSLNPKAFEYAKTLIKEGKVDRDTAWSKGQPSTEEQDTFLGSHSYDEYSKWFLGINTDKSEDTKGRYEFPIGDFKKIYREGVIAAKQRAGQYHHAEIEDAAGRLLKMIDENK